MPSPRFDIYPTLLRKAAVLLLFVSLLAVVVQAAPVPIHSTSPPGIYCGSGVVGGIRSSCDMRSGASSSLAPTGLSLNSADVGEHRQLAHLHSQELVARDEVEMVVLARRKSIAAKIRAAFHHAGNAIKHAFHKVGEGIKHAAEKVGQGIKHAAQKVGHFIKTTGAKIAKVGLKIIATAQKIASKVVGFIPGVGKPLARLMDGESKGLNKLSDAIHAHIGGKLGQAMHRMDKAQKVVGYIP